jgi:ATP-dependent Clp protease protease subunit
MSRLRITTYIIITWLLFNVIHAITARASSYNAVPERTLYITGSIGGLSILKQAQQLLNMSDSSHDPIYLVINSPGGEVITGTQFVSAMRVAKARGVVLKCLVPMAAASMAFIIYNECSERYALSQSLFLWHSIRSMLLGVYTPAELGIIQADMLRFQSNFDSLMQSELDISAEEFYYHYHNNSLLPALYLHSISPYYMTLVDDITGVLNVYDVVGTGGDKREQGEVGESGINNNLIWFGEWNTRENTNVRGH